MNMKHVAGVIAAVLLSLVTVYVAYAVAAYHGNWGTQPYWGSWIWDNATYVKWTVDDQWTSSGASALRWEHDNWPYKEFRIEREAYNPGQSTSCDRLNVYEVQPTCRLRRILL